MVDKRESYTKEDLLASGRGELFGAKGPQLPAPSMLMMDRVIKMTETGGNFDKGYVEIYEYPRSDKAVITYTDDNRQEVVEAGNTKDALYYEIIDMEQAVSDETNEMHLDYSIDVMKIMTDIRKEWGLYYPEEN